MRISPLPGSRLTLPFPLSLQWFPFHSSAISVLHISSPCIPPLFELERIPPCPSALPNKPERDSLADSCSRWRYYSLVSQSAGSDSTTSGGGYPSAEPELQHQHKHMVLLHNNVSVGETWWWSSNKFLFIFVWIYVMKAGFGPQLHMFMSSEMRFKGKVSKPANWFSESDQENADLGFDFEHMRLSHIFLLLHLMLDHFSLL